MLFTQFSIEDARRENPLRPFAFAINPDRKMTSAGIHLIHYES